MNEMKFTARRKAGKIAFFAVMGIAAIFGFTAIVMLLWNAILPSLLHVGVIGYWQAMGLLVLSKILFGSMGGGRGYRRRRHCGGPPSHLKEKFMNMSEEEKAAFKEQWQKNWSEVKE